MAQRGVVSVGEWATATATATATASHHITSHPIAGLAVLIRPKTKWDERETKWETRGVGVGVDVGLGVGDAG